ncbi:GGDEF domain-containing protein [Comamonas aquatica]|uniref:GGDEF domain-containing protein n=1 Tax=Comamonas aquatica TaxID=225991 RepID=UPI0021B0BFDD|nr:sensor domain-containing diguanylate cyclase [Comamonas aquatica]
MPQLPPPQPFDQDDIYRTLLESTQAIPWKIDWASQRYVYVGPQIEALLGWRTDDWGTVQDWIDRIHPDERDQVVRRCVELSQAGVDHEADYRALTADQRYVWVRETVHVLRNAQGGTEALVGFIFDIHERKQTEQRLLALQRELQALSYQDSLTRVANRRRFDEALEQAWAQAQATQTPLSLLVLDIDFFKQLNDCYGHQTGDQALVQVAQALAQVCDKCNDLVARYGGEEFVVLLPKVGLDIARQVAERFRRLLQEQAIPHARSPFGQQVTVSIGAGSLVPQPGQDCASFVHAVDRLLYAAKNAGRNRVVAQAVVL